MRIRKKKKNSHKLVSERLPLRNYYMVCFIWMIHYFIRHYLSTSFSIQKKKIITYQQSESVAGLLKYVFYHCKLFSNYFNFLSIYQNSIISIQTFQCGQKDFKKWNNLLKIKSERRRFKNEKEFEKLKVFYFYLNKNLNALRCQLSKKIVQR